MRLLLSLLLLPGVVLAQGTEADYKRAAEIRRKYDGLFLNVYMKPIWFDGGNKFWYEAQREGGKTEFVLVDCKAGTKTVVKKSDLPKDDVKPPRREAPKFSEPSFDSPDGKHHVYMKDANLWHRQGKGREVQLTFNGNSDHFYDKDIYWSPDSSRFVAFTIRPGGDRKVTLIESSPADQLQPKIVTYAYLKPGDAIPQSKPHLFEIATKKEIAIDDALFKDPWAIDRLNWDKDSKRFTFLYNQRGHQVMRLVAVDAATGKASAIINEECKTFFDYSNKTYLRHLENGDILWMSERSGWNHLYRIDGKTGDVKNAVTKGEWVVHGVSRVDEPAGEVWIRTIGQNQVEDPYGQGWAVASLTGTSLTTVTPGSIGVHDVQWSPNREYQIDTLSRIDTVPHHCLRKSRGDIVIDLETAMPTGAAQDHWRPVEPFILPGRDGKTPICGYIVRPSNFDPAKKYPVIEHIYAGPHDYFVPKRFSPTVYESSMAELGFIVVKMDGMGTNWRSKAFHDVAWKNLVDAGFPDRIAVHKQLAKLHPEMDYSKGCGLYGGSAGGQSTLAGLLHHGDFYTVGVADCGCHDNRMDKIWWNEAWMGTVGPHYAEQSNVTNAHKLKGKLMLVVGEVDRNVDPASTMQVANALIKANKDFDLLVLPGVGHGAAETPYGSRRRADFFVRNLMGVEPRK